jgi:arylformamidase
VLAGPDVRRDLAYGPRPRQRYDLVPAMEPARAVVVYLHAGYWQGRDKADFAFLAPTFTALGCDVALANYPLAPGTAVAGITEAARALVPALRAATAARDGAALPVVLVGHSAGAHLAVELALTDWGPAVPAGAIAAVVALSGVFDLAPLVATSLNQRLDLDAASARAASPLWRVGRRATPALFAVGGGETPAFHDQTERMAAAWRAAGHRGEAMRSPRWRAPTIRSRGRSPPS